MTSLINMENTPEEAQEQAGVTPELPKYPWGLCITLDSEALAKLNVTALPAVDTEVTILAKAKVTGSRSNVTTDGENRSVDLQITDMQIEGMQSDLMKAAAEMLYGKK